VVIVGSGPAGTATALALLQREPALAGDVVLLERSRHPRDKTCAGGLSPRTLAVLASLGVPLTVPNVRVDAAAVWVPGARVDVPGRDLSRIVRRREFDAMLARAARERGAVLRENVTVRALARQGDGIRVETDAGAYQAGVVVGADGSGSLVRRRLLPGATAEIARARMADVPLEGSTWDGHARRRYEFDFRDCARGLRGYAWAFPCLIDGRPHANVGAYALPPATTDVLDIALARQIGRLGADATSPRKAFPIHAWTRGRPLAAPHVLLVGDAAGIDPLLGEGISYALEFGVAAAEAIVVARQTGDWSFAGWTGALERGVLGRKLTRLRHLATAFYGPLGGACFRAARVSRRAQRVGLDWYNGVAAGEGQGRLAALRALLGSAPAPVS
jgi:flavin-dependent dehydrogenase